MAGRTTEKLTRWDSADYIEDVEDAMLYLEVAIDEDDGDGRLVRRALDAIVRAQNVSKLARETGLHRGTLYETLSENGNPSFATVLTLVRTFGWRIRLEEVKPPTAS